MCQFTIYNLNATLGDTTHHALQFCGGFQHPLLVQVALGVSYMTDALPYELPPLVFIQGTEPGTKAHQFV
jgi:hypothetical protein